MEKEQEGISLSNTQIIRGVSILIGLGCLIPGLVLIRFEILRLVFPDIDLGQAGVLWRIHYVQIFFLIVGYVVLFLGWLITKLPGFDTWPERYIGGIVSLALTVYLLVSLEAIASTRYKADYFPTDPNIVAREQGATFLKSDFYGHILNPESKTPYMINSAGFRGEEFPVRKEENEFRIVALGDSIIFGIVQEEDETATIPYYLQQLLQDQSQDDRLYRVINSGVPGYDSLQVLRTLKHRVLDLEPDLIVVMVGWNDLSYSISPNWYPRISLSTGDRPTFTPALLKLARDLRPEPTSEPTTNRVPHPRALKTYRRNLESIIDVAEGREIKVILTNLPTILSTQGNTPEELEKAARYPEVENVLMFEQVIGEVCAERENANVLCVRNLFPLEESNKDPFFFDHCHPYREGNYIIAQQLVEAIQILQKR